MVEITRVLAANALNGETPGWSAARRRLFWIDTREPALHLFDPATGRDESWTMPSLIGAYGLTEEGVVIALRTGLYRFDLSTGALDFLAPPPCDPRRFVLNDGGCDPAGRFLVGAMYEPLAPGDGQPDAPQRTPLWRHDPREGWVALSGPACVSNGLAWSPDGRILYRSDTASHTIWAYDYDPGTGAAENRRLFARVEAGGGEGGPDGAAVDRDGHYWCAVFGGGCLLRYDPSGRLERRVELPCRYPTMPAFGGDDLGTLFVTSANKSVPPEERTLHPDEGALFAFRAPVPGLPLASFRG